METWQSPATIALWISIGLILVFLLSISIVYLVRANIQRYAQAKTKESELKQNHRQELVEVSIETQEQERLRIAADLHDGLIGKLTAIRLKSQLGNLTTEFDSAIEESISLTRQISHNLAPPMLEYTSVYELICEVLDPWKKELDIVFIPTIRSTDCSAEVKLQILRSLQEVLKNTFKHAQAKQVTVSLFQNNNRLVVDISDDGIGFLTDQQPKGIGLANIQARMRRVGGLAHIKSSPGNGTAISLVIPLNT